MMFFHSSQLLYGDELRARREALRAVLSAVVHEGGVINLQPDGRRDSIGRLEGSAASAGMAASRVMRIALTIGNCFMLASRSWIFGLGSLAPRKK
jgi:hypothetical protein